MSSKSGQHNATLGFDPVRRKFLSAVAAAAGVSLAPGVMLYGIARSSATAARPRGSAASADVRWGMLIDLGHCDDGCNECVTACNTENGLRGHGRPSTDAQWIRKIDIRDPQTGAARSLPMMCQHCAEPACVDVCPTGASFKRADGIVLVDKHTCIGCRYCMMACPYKARSFVHETLEDQKPHAPRGKGTVESCTLCVHRVDDGGQPACVESCSNTGGGAMLFGDLKDPDSEISRRVATYATQQVRADLGLDPGVRYSNL
ncbi:MAG: 4Fe-4S dicluster domain-containing protein [Xanthomonadales bacterium]|nr:4Fe-4S dicluster domain-containing protein [Xanthomonadales bacterium]